MDKKAATAIAKDVGSTQEQLEAAIGCDPTVDRLLAKHPKSGSQLLEKLSHSSDATTRKYVSVNPNTPKEVLIRLAPQFPRDFFRNPAFEWLLVEDPGLLFGLESVLKNILKLHDCPEAFMRWTAVNGSDSQKQAVAMNSEAPADVLEVLAKDDAVSVASAASAHAKMQSDQGKVDLAQAFVDEFLRNLKEQNPKQFLVNFKKKFFSAGQMAAYEGKKPKANVMPNERGGLLFLADKLVDSACNSTNLCVRLLGLSHHHAQPQALAKCSKSVHWIERMAIAKNPNTPRNIIEVLIKDPHQLVSAQALATDRLKKTVREEQDSRLASCSDVLDPKSLAVALQDKVDSLVWQKWLTEGGDSSKCMKLLGTKWERYLPPAVRIGYGVHTPKSILNEMAKSEDLEVLEYVAFHPNCDKEIRVALSLHLVREGNVATRRRVAETPDIPAELLEILSLDKEPWVRSLVASNPSTPITTLNKLAVDRSSDVKCALLENPSVTSEIVSILAQDTDSDVLFEVARFPHLPKDVIKFLAISKDGNIRVAIASNPSTLPETLLLLATDKDDYVRETVARNPFLPQDSLRALVHDKKPNVQANCLLNPSLDNDLAAELIEKYERDQDTSLRALVASSSLLSDDTLEFLSKDQNWGVKINLVKNPITNESVLRELAKTFPELVVSRPGIPKELVASIIEDTAHEVCKWEYRHKAGSIKKFIASYPDTPKEYLELLHNESSDDVREAVAQNHSTPTYILEKLALDAVVDVRVAATANPSLSHISLAHSAKDKQWKVRFAVANNQHSPLDALSCLSEDPVERVCLAVTENPNCSSDLLLKIAGNANRFYSTRLSAIKHPNYPDANRDNDEKDLTDIALNWFSTRPDMLQDNPLLDDYLELMSIFDCLPKPDDKKDITKNMKSKNWLERLGVLMTSKLTQANLRLMMEDDVEIVRQLAAKRIKELET